MDEVDYLREQKQQERDAPPPKTNGGEVWTDDPPENTRDSELTDASGYQSGIERFEFKPDDDNPDFVFVLWLRTRALKASDQGIIQNRVNQLSIDNANLERLRNKLSHLKPDSRVERNEKTLAEMSPDDDEFKTDENLYWEKRERLAKQVDEWMREYEETHSRIQAEINAILAKPNFYQTLRAELFARVIHDHTIGLPIGPNGSLEKVDFASSEPRYELSDELTNALQKFIWDRIKKKGRSAKQKSNRSSR